MPEMIIPIYPPAIVNDPDIKRSLEHTLTTCDECSQDGWIGPAQKTLAQRSGCRVLCVPCLFRLYPAGKYTLNSGIDDVPRRNPEPWQMK